VVRVVYARFLSKQKRNDEAAQQLEAAIGYVKDNPLSHYNIGLAYFDMGQYDKALVQAHKALALGLDRTELVDQLKAANQWQEPAN
jgi:tetratricopeptide (TPR) repeat protein